MIRKTINTLILLILFSCTKDEQKSFAYWNEMVNNKYTEIRHLTESVKCTDINEFDIVKTDFYYLVHPSIKMNSTNFRMN
jgi:hypothetical protein